MLRAWCAVFEITIQGVTSAANSPVSFHKPKFPSITNTGLQMKTIEDWTSENTDKHVELRKRLFVKCAIAIIRVQMNVVWPVWTSSMLLKMHGCFIHRITLQKLYTDRSITESSKALQ